MALAVADERWVVWFVVFVVAWSVVSKFCVGGIECAFVEVGDGVFTAYRKVGLVAVANEFAFLVDFVASTVV